MVSSAVAQIISAAAAFVLAAWILNVDVTLAKYSILALIFYVLILMIFKFTGSKIQA